MRIEEIEHLAKLARIELRGGEASVLAENITSILGYVSDIQEITGGDDLTKQVGPVHNVFREDENPRESGVFTEKLLAAAPEREGQYFKVKKILGES